MVPRAFSLNSSITQHDAVSRHGPVPTVDSVRRGRLESPLDKVHVDAMNEWPGPGSALRGSASKLTGHLPGSQENGRSRPRHSLISSLIHLRTLASIGVYDWPLSSETDLYGQSCRVIRNPEKAEGQQPLSLPDLRDLGADLCSGNPAPSVG